MRIELDTTQLEKARTLIAQANCIIITTHMAPDGDAMGSALAMYHWLSVFSDQCSVNIIVPNAFPEFFNWMPGVEHIHVFEKEQELCKSLIDKADLFICTDFNDPKRIGPIGEKMVASSAPKILIDHHLNPVDFADVVFSFPEATSASEIAFRFIQSNPSNPNNLNLQIATCIYTGLMTDTGNFSFNSTSCELYEIIAELIRAGIQKDEIYNAVFNQYSTDRVRLTGYALYRKMRIYPDYHLSLITLSADELDRYHYKVGDTEGLVNMPLQISDVYYSVFMREERAKPGTPKSRIRISFRSQGDRPVNIWASEIFHGGGHANASGGEIFGTIEQAVQIFEKTMAKYVAIEKKQR
ncbi:MAG: DHH family phosphoesterase [Paludibacteraceae bacterium]|nr:DHH family phosphoesterase [Paludibacteraceae bacterium]